LELISDTYLEKNNKKNIKNKDKDKNKNMNLKIKKVYSRRIR
jgi:hypothetical protein